MFLQWYSLRKLISLVLRGTLISLVGWGIIVPLTYIIPRKEKSVIIIGKNGKFVDNAKYLFLYLFRLREKDIKVSFILKDQELYSNLKSQGLPVLLHPTPASIWEMLKASAVITAGDGLSHLGYYYAFRAYKVQMWHGAGMKVNNRSEKIMGKGTLAKAIFEHFQTTPVYDLVISTSPFYTENVFSKKFKSKEIIETGYPRNDCLFQDLDDGELMLGCDKSAFTKIKEKKNQGCKIVLYSPTFRFSGEDPVIDAGWDLETLCEFGRQHNIIFVFKMHPSSKPIKRLKEMSHVWEYDRHCDIYPVFKYIDLMITDYSSIFMDYILLDRPVLFFPYDYENYIAKNTDIRFDYDWITPGPKCYNPSDLQQLVYDVLKAGKDGYQDRRREMAELAFRYKDGFSSKRIWQHISARI